jgi:hypothetical protein
MEKAGVTLDPEGEEAPPERERTGDDVPAGTDLSVFRDFINSLDFEDFEKRRDN